MSYRVTISILVSIVLAIGQSFIKNVEPSQRFLQPKPLHSTTPSMYTLPLRSYLGTLRLLVFLIDRTNCRSPIRRYSTPLLRSHWTLLFAFPLSLNRHPESCSCRPTLSPGDVASPQYTLQCRSNAAPPKFFVNISELLFSVEIHSTLITPSSFKSLKK